MLVFLQQLAQEMANQGKNITVISPLQVNLNLNYCKIPYHTTEMTEQGQIIDVYWPKIFGLGQSHLIMGKSPVHVTTYFLEKAAEKVIKNLNTKPDVIYGHFLAPAGIVAARLGRKFGVPAFFAFGEAHNTIEQFGAKKAKKELNSISGVVAVSTFLKNEIMKNDLVPPYKVEVFPNGIRKEKFKKIEKHKARDYFELPQDAILIGFVGAFNERKGILRLCKALESVPNVKLICAGKGEQQPYGDKCIFARALNHEEIPIFISAADIFVLPTLLEGCSNAIVEAMACGVPVISSNREFNDDILDDTCSIRIDPTNINEISKAINILANDSNLRKCLSEGALEKAQKLTLDVRAKNIIDFIERKIEDYYSDGNII